MLLRMAERQVFLSDFGMASILPLQKIPCFHMLCRPPYRAPELWVDMDKHNHTARALLVPTVDIGSYGTVLFDTKTCNHMFTSVTKGSHRSVKAWVQTCVEAQDQYMPFVRRHAGRRLHGLPPVAAQTHTHTHNIFRCCHRLPRARTLR